MEAIKKLIFCPNQTHAQLLFIIVSNASWFPGIWYRNKNPEAHSKASTNSHVVLKTPLEIY